jgi:hypothetical protein
MMFTKSVTANQAHFINRYKNITYKVLKYKADMYTYKQCLDNNLTPRFADIKIRNMSLSTCFIKGLNIKM